MTPVLTLFYRWMPRRIKHTIMPVRDVNHTLTYDVNATTPVVGGAKGGAELYIRMDSKAEKK